MRPEHCECRPLLATLLLLAAFVPRSVDGSGPLFSLLQGAPNVAQFTQLLNSSGLGVQMSGSQTCSKIICFLVFAPNNAAMTAANVDPAFSAVDKVALAKNHHISSIYVAGAKGVLASWPSLGSPVGTDIGFGQVQILQTAAKSTLFWVAKGSGASASYRVNNAAIVVGESDQVADNGVFHVLDQVLLPIGNTLTVSNLFSTSPPELSAQLSITQSLSLFNTLMTSDTAKSYVYDALLGSGTKVRTIFLPSDAAWARIPAAALAALTSSPDDFRNVLLAHFAPDVCVFTSWMTLGSSITFTMGVDGEQTYPAKMYLDSAQKSFVSVGGVVAQFVDKSINYPIGDAVIHVIDRVLAFSPDTLATLAQANAPGFYSLCIAVPSCQNILTATNMTRTLFAPSDVTVLNSLNSTLLEQILLLHFVPSAIGKPDMTDSNLITALNGVGTIRFRMTQNNTRYFVEGRLPNRGFVRAELLMYDLPGKSGSLFHQIAFPLGQPRQTVQDFINSFQDLSNVSASMGSTAFDPNLGTATASYTVFPPNNAAMKAFAAYKGSSGTPVGQTILSSVTLRNRVLRRIVLPNQKIVVDVAASGASDIPTANTAENEKLTLNIQGSAGLATRSATVTGSFVQTSVNLTAGQYECTNGMVYPIGAVLFRDSDIEGYARSAGTVSSSLAVAVLTVLLACLAKL